VKRKSTRFSNWDSKEDTGSSGFTPAAKRHNYHVITVILGPRFYQRPGPTIAIRKFEISNRSCIQLHAETSELTPSDVLHLAATPYFAHHS
jgi:hypothetical protein